MHADIFLKEFAPLASGPGGVQKLREMVLQLAVRGKLVPQFAGDDDAKTILMGIEKEPDPAIKKRIAKYQTADPLFQTPINWVWTAIGRVSRDWGQKIPDKPFLYIDVGGIDNLKGKISASLELTQPENAPSRARKLISRGTVLYSTVRPYLKNIAIVDREFETEAIASTAFAIVHPLGGIMPEFVFYFLRSPDFVAYVEGQMMGVAYPAINDGKFFAAPIPLPPLAEQKRIVAKVDELMALCDELEAKQAEETGLKRTTAASALHHLTEAKTPEETASSWSLVAARFAELFDDLEMIKELRGALAQLGLRGELVEQRDNEEPPVLSIPKLDSEPPYPLPKNWQWVPFSEIATFQNGDRSKKYPNRSEYVPEGVPWINTGHIEPDGSLSQTSMHYITEEKFESLGGGKIQPGDLVYCLRGATFGKTAYVEPFDRGAIASSLMIIRPGAEINRRYAFIYLTSPLGRQQLKRFDNGTAQPNLSAAAVKKYLVPLPPPAEQERIVAKIVELMALCDRLEEKVREGERLNAELMSSLVHALTETDPDGGGDVEPLGLQEPASEVATTKQANRETNQRHETESKLRPLSHEPGVQAARDRARSVDTKFQEAVLVATIVNTFFQVGGEPIGNFRLQKAVYFARRRIGEHVDEMAYLKKAAGPYNPSMKYSGGIAIAKQKNWLREARGRFGFGHVPGPDVSEAGEWIDTYGYAAPARWVAEHFRYKKNEEWEALATVDYAIEHLQAHGIEPDAAQILQYIASDSEWRPKIEKLRLTEMSVGTAMLEVQTLFSAQGEGGAA